MRTTSTVTDSELATQKIRHHQLYRHRAPFQQPTNTTLPKYGVCDFMVSPHYMSTIHISLDTKMASSQLLSLVNTTVSCHTWFGHSTTSSQSMSPSTSANTSNQPRRPRQRRLRTQAMRHRMKVSTRRRRTNRPTSSSLWLSTTCPSSHAFASYALHPLAVCCPSPVLRPEPLKSDRSFQWLPSCARSATP